MKTKRVLFNVALIALLFLCCEGLIFACQAIPAGSSPAYPGPGEDTWTPRPTATVTPTRTPRPTWVTPMPIYYELTLTALALTPTETETGYPVAEIAATEQPVIVVYLPCVIR